MEGKRLVNPSVDFSEEVATTSEIIAIARYDHLPMNSGLLVVL